MTRLVDEDLRMISASMTELNEHQTSLTSLVESFNSTVIQQQQSLANISSTLLISIDNHMALFWEDTVHPQIIGMHFLSSNN
jgi:hypothetical protein